jgi:hypothetical protein
MKILFRAYFHQNHFQKKVDRKFIKVSIRIRIRSKIVRIQTLAERHNFQVAPAPQKNYLG